MTHQYDWSRLDAGWQFDGVGNLIDCEWDLRFSVTDFENGEAYTEYWHTVRAQLVKCRVNTNTNAQFVNDYLSNRMSALMVQAEALHSEDYVFFDGPGSAEIRRKHEATHGWRNPPCIYDGSEDNEGKIASEQAQKPRRLGDYGPGG